MLTDVPYRVTTQDGKVRLVIMNADDGLPAAFALMGTRAERKVAIRIAGGCKGMSEDDKDAMLDFFRAAFDGYRGVAFSGASRMVVNGDVDPMVTDVPGVIAAHNPGSVALGTVPRTELLTLQGESRLVLDQWGNVPNPSMHGILIVQNGPDGESGWDGDVDTYFRLMENWKKYAGFTQIGLVAWNGGPITKDEIVRSVKRGWPVFLIQGSGRETDAYCEALHDAGTIDRAMQTLLFGNEHVHIVQKDDSNMLRYWLSEYGFLSRSGTEVG